MTIGNYHAKGRHLWCVLHVGPLNTRCYEFLKKSFKLGIQWVLFGKTRDACPASGGTTVRARPRAWAHSFGLTRAAFGPPHAALRDNCLQLRQGGTGGWAIFAFGRITIWIGFAGCLRRLFLFEEATSPMLY